MTYTKDIGYTFTADGVSYTVGQTVKIEQEEKERSTYWDGKKGTLITFDDNDYTDYPFEVRVGDETVWVHKISPVSPPEYHRKDGENSVRVRVVEKSDRQVVVQYTHVDPNESFREVGEYGVFSVEYFEANWEPVSEKCAYCGRGGE